MEETWRAVSGSSFFEVSDLGRVRRTDKRGRLFDVAQTFTNGYCYAGIRYDSGVRKRVAVHHLVLLAFVGPRGDGLQCRHLNGVRNDNRARNLAWGTAAENTADKFSHGTVLAGEANGNCKLTRRRAAVAHLLISQCFQPTNIARWLGVSRQSVGRIARGDGWTGPTR